MSLSSGRLPCVPTGGPECVLPPQKKTRRHLSRPPVNLWLYYRLLETQIFTTTLKISDKHGSPGLKLRLSGENEDELDKSAVLRSGTLCGSFSRSVGKSNFQLRKGFNWIFSKLLEVFRDLDDGR